MLFIFCEGCKWEFDFKNCQNMYKEDIKLKNKDGSMQVGYCDMYKKGE